MDRAGKARLLGALYAAFFGAFTAFVIWSDWANRLFAKPLDVLCTPVRLLYGLSFGTNAAYLDWYFILCIAFMSGLGYALGFFLYKSLQARRRAPRAPDPRTP